jgi:hypothetical protein
MPVTTQINVEGFMERLTRVYDARLGMAAEYVATKQREYLSQDYPPASVRGQSPHRRTGHLQAEVQVVKTAPLVRLIGSNAEYATALELKYERPFLLKSLMRNTDKIVDIVVGDTGDWVGVRPFAGSFAPGFAPGALGEE